MIRRLIAAFALLCLSTLAQAVPVTFAFSGLTLAGFEFSMLLHNTVGKLTQVSINATLNNSVNDTFANDLTIYVDYLPLDMGGLLQVGGFSNLGAAEHHSWGNGDSNATGTVVSDTISLTTPIVFAGMGSDPQIWLGNGFGSPDTSGTWSGTVTLNFEPLVIAAVPEPGILLLALLAVATGAGATRARHRRGKELAQS